MKTAISIPDEVFDEAERLARRTKRSRSEIYTRALAEYLARHVDDQVTERMNETLRDLGIEEDAFVSAASRRILAQVEW
jgi:predicted transcriptional regulator